MNSQELLEASERRCAELAQALEVSQSRAREAERLSRLKDDFLATLSHELRTPLNAILGWSQILSGPEVSPADVAEGLQTIERSARAQTQLIEDLQDVSRIASGRMRLDVQRVDLSSVIRAAVSSVQPLADARETKLQTVLDGGAGPVSGDPSRLQQVVWNLLANAVKFSPRGGRVRVVLERVNSHLEISVTDSGQGIKADALPHVFDLFRRGDHQSSRRGPLGIGLSLVKQLVELHGGRVHARSGGENQGATFLIELPLAVVQDGGGKREHPGSPSGNGDGLVDLPKLEGVRVLVVDDEPDAREMLRRVLEMRGARVVIAGGGMEAIEALRRERPEVIVSDVGMPDLDGYEMIRLVRSLPVDHGGRTPAIALTAFTRSEDRRRAMLAGFQVHIAKPVEAAELIATVANLSGRAGGGGERV
jgi:CheY-like chemotaxis protein/nitrogen-specific signal transduction histidine kinase